MTRKRAVCEERLDGNVEKRAPREVGPAVVSRKRAALADNAAQWPPGHDGREQDARLHVPPAEVRGLPSSVSDENDEVISEKATIRDLRARFPGSSDAFTTVSSGFPDDKAELPVEAAAVTAQKGRLCSQPAWPTPKPASPMTQPARLTAEKRVCRPNQRDFRADKRGWSRTRVNFALKKSGFLSARYGPVNSKFGPKSPPPSGMPNVSG
jgi:hypothetical protein